MPQPTIRKTMQEIHDQLGRGQPLVAYAERLAAIGRKVQQITRDAKRYVVTRFPAPTPPRDIDLPKARKR